MVVVDECTHLQSILVPLGHLGLAISHSKQATKSHGTPSPPVLGLTLVTQASQKVAMQLKLALNP